MNGATPSSNAGQSHGPAKAPGMFDRAAPWTSRLSHIVDTMRELSRQTDPQEMVNTYGERMEGAFDADRMVSISRRDLARPWYRITRSSTWAEDINPWLERHRLPRFDRGMLGELLYADEPRIINDLRVSADDPAREYFDGMRSLLAVPHFDQGLALNMVVFMTEKPDGINPENVPEIVWFNNLFGRATHNLVLSKELRDAYEIVDRELSVVAEIQQSLLPAELPSIPGVELAAHYRTARHAGGDYYDFFPLTDGKWGVLIADVSGHGAPAAVVMAITHTLAHADPERRCCPDVLLDNLNRNLIGRYTAATGSFVTAFYGVYDPGERSFLYSCAGHNPPRLYRAGADAPDELRSAQGLPLGVLHDADYTSASVSLRPADTLVLYTDGITEARFPQSERHHTVDMYGVKRLDTAVLAGKRSAPAIVERVLESVEAYTEGGSPDDDRTLVVMTAS
ncbi:MAG: PP2C family protein-serine/threonine phosphatase [Phycisphaerales bacterium]